MSQLFELRTVGSRQSTQSLSDRGTGMIRTLLPYDLGDLIPALRPLKSGNQSVELSRFKPCENILISVQLLRPDGLGQFRQALAGCPGPHGRLSGCARHGVPFGVYPLSSAGEENVTT